jgi:hypothetical protein
MATKYWIGTDGNYATTTNWSPTGLPVANDIVVLTAGSGSITTGLTTLGAVALHGFYVQPGYTGTIGVPQTFLQVLLASGYPVEYNGSGQAYIDFMTSAVSPSIVTTLNTSAPQIGLYVRGSALVELDIFSGSVGVAALGDSATVGVINVNSGSSSATYVNIGAGTTLTTLAVIGGTVVASCALTTLLVTGGVVSTAGTGAITTLTNSGGTVFPISTGTITTLNVNGGTTDFGQSASARTVTTLNANGNSATIAYNPSIVTVTNKLTPASSCTITIRPN